MEAPSVLLLKEEQPTETPGNEVLSEVASSGGERKEDSSKVEEGSNPFCGPRLIRSLICNNCGYSACYRLELRKHMRRAHSSTYSCKHCDFRASLASLLKAHILSRHSGENVHKCQYCDYSSTSTSTIQTHVMSKHTGERPHKCEFCDYSATQATNLKAHIVSKHTGERPHRCQLCEYSTAYASTLKNHISSRTTQYRATSQVSKL